VLRATIFFISISTKALNLEDVIVIMPNIDSINMLGYVRIRNEKLNNSTNPPVTSVLLCTSALTGVGALIAFGSHEPKGN
jgi:hypothetical protein